MEPKHDLLARLTAEIEAVALAVAAEAASHVAQECIYGFCLYHGHFAYVGVTVFTEAGLERAVARYREQGGTATADDLRWSPCDSSHHMYREAAFERADDLFLELERAGAPYDDRALLVERAALRALRNIRERVFLDPSVLLTLMEGDQGMAQRYAYAERLNAPETLERFRQEISRHADWEHLDFYRSRIPAF